MELSYYEITLLVATIDIARLAIRRLLLNPKISEKDEAKCKLELDEMWNMRIRVVDQQTLITNTLIKG